MSSLDVVFVRAFDHTQSTKLYHARVREVQAMVKKKLAQFPGSCFSSIYPELACNRYTTWKTEVDNDGSIKNIIESNTTKGCYENMASGLPEAQRLISLSSKNPRGIIFLFSDGSTTNKGRFFDKAEDFVSKYPVHTFTLGSDAYNPGLCNIAANSSGGTFNSIPTPDKPDQSSPLSLLLDGILSGSMKDDEKPPTSNSGTGSNEGLVSIKEVKYLKDDAALTADTVTAEVEIRATSSAAVREGLDLVAVLDVSCRKDTAKIENLKKAMKFVIMKLTPFDRLSIVTFCDGAARLNPLRCMTPAAKKELIAIVNGLSVSARGSRCDTNIKAGLDNGLAVIAHRVNTVARTANIFLVSDRKQTVGNARVVDPGQVAVYTFCLGSDSDHQQLLSSLATKSPGGMFSVVPDGANLSVPLSRVLGGLLTVVAQDVQLTLALKESTSGRLSMVARGIDYTSIVDKGVKTIKFGTLFAGEGRKVLINLRVNDSTATQEYEAILAEAHLVFTAQGKEQWQTRPHDTQIKILRTPNPCHPDHGNSSKARQVQAERVRREQAKAIREAIGMADAENLYDARNTLERAQKELENIVALDDGQKLVTWLRAELLQLSRFMDSNEIYKAKGRAYALASEASHARQRYCARGADDDDADDAFTTPRMDTYREQAKNFEKDPTAPVPSADEDVKKELASIPLAAISGDLAYNLRIAIEALQAIQKIVTATA